MVTFIPGETQRIAGLLAYLCALAHEAGQVMSYWDIYEAVRFARGSR